MRKTVLVLTLIVVVLFTATFCMGYFRLGFALGEEVVAEQVHVNATLLENGDIQIEETSTFRYKNRGRDWWNFYRTFHWEDLDDIRDISVYDHDFETTYAFTDTYSPTNYPDSRTPFNTCYLTGGAVYLRELQERGLSEEHIDTFFEEYGENFEWEIGFNFPPLEKGRRTFTLRYTLSGVKPIEKYSDADVLYFKFVQENTYPIKNFSMNLTFPNVGSTDELDAWLHCEAPGTLTIQDSNHLLVTANHIPGDVFLELRMLMPAGSLQNAPQQHSGPIRAEIVQEEEAWAAAWFDDERYRWFVAVVFVVLGIAIVVASSALKTLQRRLDEKSIALPESPDYERQPPYPVSPAVAGRLIDYVTLERDGKNNKDAMIVASTLNLVQKGWLSMEYEPSKQGERVLRLVPGRGHTPRTEEEIPLYSLYSAAAHFNGGKFSMYQYKSYAKKHYTNAQHEFSNYFRLTEKAFRKQKWSIRFRFFSSFCTWFCVGFLALAAVLTFGFDFFGRSMLIIGSLLGAANLFFGALYRVRLTAAGRKAYARWLGFKRYLTDYSLLAEREPQEVTLWGDYLVYGTALGVSRKALAKFAGLAPRNVDAVAENAQKQQDGTSRKEPSFAPDRERETMTGALYSTTNFSEQEGHSSGYTGNGAVFSALGSNFINVFQDIRSVGEALNISNRESSRISSLSSGSSSGGSSSGSSSSSSSSGGGGGGGGGSSGFR